MRLSIATILFAALFPAFLFSQNQPIQGMPFTVFYSPKASGVFTNPTHLELVYVFNYWNTRYGTRLALWQNVISPDTTRVKRIPLHQTSLGWEAAVPLDSNAAVFSYYVTDGVKRDDNNRKTYTTYVMNKDGQPVRNARYFMTSFLELAGANLTERAREAEGEVSFHPYNIRAYPQLFSLLMDRDRGSELTQRRIVEMLDNLEQKYPEAPDVLNLCARTYYYIFRDTKRGLSYKERIDAREQWPEVVMMLDREQLVEDNRKAALENEKRRAALMNAPLPAYKFTDLHGAEWNMKNVKDKAIVIVFWVTGSDQSKRLLPMMQSMKEKLGQSAEIITVTVDKEPQAAARFMQARKLTLPLYTIPDEAIEKLGIDGLPYTMVVDKRGIVRNIFLGLTSTIENDIANALSSLR